MAYSIDRRVALLERLVPVMGQTISAMDTALNTIGNIAPEQSPYLQMASRQLEEAKRILLDYSLSK